MKRAPLKRACVIGWPISHSRSPLIHGYWLNKYGIEGSYTKEAVRPEELSDFIRAIGPDGFIGCNVTVPHKEAAYHLTAELRGLLHAHSSGSVANTLWWGGGRLHATSTDAYGFITHLLACAPDFKVGPRLNKTVMILGAGGAAKSVIGPLVGVKELRIANRSMERATEAVRFSSAPTRVIPWEDRSRALAGVDLLVNTTTLGMVGQPPLDIDLSLMPPDAVVYDIVYVPLETPLLRAARERGLRTIDGLGMLLHQAVPGFLKWFGTRPEVTRELHDLIVADINKSA
jgi:shikimate dehydrogenase